MPRFASLNDAGLNTAFHQFVPELAGMIRTFGYAYNPSSAAVTWPHEFLVWMAVGLT